MDKTINSIPTTPIGTETQNREGVELTQDAFTPKMTDQEFGDAVDSKIQYAIKYWAPFRYKERTETNAKYWQGDQVNRGGLRDDQEKSVDNVIFRNIETFIPIATSRTPQVGATPAYKNETTRTYSQDVRRTLQTEWEVFQNMQQKMSQGIRNHQANFLGLFKLGIDTETNEFWTEEVPITDCVISKNGDFIAQYIKNKTLGDLIDMFPEKKEDILKELGYGLVPSKKLLDSPVEYIEAWTDEVVGWKMKNLTLGVGKNPHFMYSAKEVQIGQDPQTGQPLTAEVKFNHFKRPKMPWVFLRYFSKGRHIMDETTLIEQAIGLQDWINKRKRQIGANADSTNGHWVSSGDFISQEEFDKIEGGIDEKIWLENGMPRDGLIKITGQALPDYIYNDLLDSRNAADNLMGTHSTTRGEKSGNDTLGQDIMAKDQDYGRVDGYVRDGIEKAAQDWYEYMYHMYLVYMDEDKSIAIPAEDDLEDSNVIFSQDRVPLIKKKDGTTIPVPMVLRVKQGSTLPIDEMAEYQKAQQAKDILRPMDYWKKVGEPNPKQLEKNYLMWINDPFAAYADDKEIQAMLQKMQQKGEAPKMSVSVRADAMTPTGAQLLEDQGLLPKGTAAALARLSPKAGTSGTKNEDNGKTVPPKGEQPPTDMVQPPTSPPQDVPPEMMNGNMGGGMKGMSQAKQGLVNAMTQMLRSGEAQKIMSQGKMA